MELYENVYKDLYRMAYFYLGNAYEAEDAVSETTLKAYEKFDSLRDESSFKNWIFKILVNQCNTRLRKQITKKTYELKEEISYEPKMEDEIVVKELLEHLNKEERLIVVLSVFCGYKGEEIAKLLRKSHNTIRSKYRRALKKLEEKLLAEEVQYEK